MLNDQIGFKRQLIYHFYPGVIILVFYLLFTHLVMDLGLPGFAGLLLVELLVLPPVELAHMAHHGKRLNGYFTFKGVIGYRSRLSMKEYVIWSLIGIVGCTLIYAPLYPLGLVFRETVFAWLPTWFFNPFAGTDDVELVAKVFIAAIVIDGIIGPVVEELFFRGYLLPRMAYLEHWAPIVNGALFGLYHFWQPHNYLAIVGVGIVLSWVVWKKQNVYLGIIIHCTLNLLGAIGGYFAVVSGDMIAR
jgi:membrane protease YdiL (CAAX protease family)